MTSWNYRIVKQIDKDRQYFTIREVYFDDNGNPDSVTKEEMSPGGETLEELMKDYERYKKAFDSPIIIYDALNDVLIEDK